MHDKNLYGPLAGLIGTWIGDKGVDVAPEPDGCEECLYHETITYTEVGNVKNAGKQNLAVLHYHQLVKRKSNSEVFHHENGYWMWDADNNTIMHSLAIPRGVCLLAGGVYNTTNEKSDSIVLEVQASAENSDWGIVQSPFMADNAKTKSFVHKIELTGNKMTYEETTLLEIYGREFEHSDKNELVLQ